MNASAGKTIRELALELPNATRVFEKLGIDYCCGGNKSLTDACATAKIPVDKVLADLAAGSERPDAVAKDWSTEKVSDLVAHIVDTHHQYVKTEIPRLEGLLEKVCAKHGPNHPELLEIHETFRDLASELTSHMLKEEQILFPYLVKMDYGISHGEPVPRPMFGSVQNPVRMMMVEHDSAGDALREIRQTSKGFVAPADACVSFQTLYRGLEEFEQDLHQHIHLENNILFPRSLEMENAA